MKKTLMMLAALMTIALFAGCSDDDDDVLTPPDENTEQSENTDNQGEENEGDENEGDEDEGDENQGDENDDNNDGNDGDDDGNDGDNDDNDGDDDDNDGNDGNDGDDNDGDDNDGDDNDGDDDTTGGVVPSDKVTEWGESVWEDLGTNTYPSEEVTTNDFTYSDGLLNFVNGDDGKGVKFGKTLSTYCAKLQGKGNATTDCFQFKVNTNGTLKVAVTSGNKSDERSVQVYVDGEAYGDALSCPGYDGLTEPKEHSVEVTGISGETTIAIASANNGNNIFVIGWTPTGVTE